LSRSTSTLIQKNESASFEQIAKTTPFPFVIGDSQRLLADALNELLLLLLQI
jgi:hypothetical protein